MLLWETIRTALRALSSNLVRTTLTMLGVIIGVGAVVAMLALGEGARTDIESNIRTLGSDLLTVRPGQQSHGPVRSGTVDTLDVADANALALLPGVSNVAPTSMGAAQVKYASQNLSATIVGSTSNYFAIRNLETQAGQPFTHLHEQGRRRVAILGAKVARDLFGYDNPVGARIQIKGIGFRVEGVLAEKGESLGSPDDQVIVPLSTHQSVLFGQTYVQSILVQVADEDSIESIRGSLERTLRARHRIAAGGLDDFNIGSMQDMLSTINQVTGTLTALLGGVAAVSLIVGGIGIMNIMLVSVRERTREVGVRMAVGARRRDILLQFLIEAMVVSVMGGILGIGLGIGGAAFLSKMGGFGFLIPPYAVVLALITSLATGIFFGVWPARHAAHLDPVEALRFE